MKTVQAAASRKVFVHWCKPTFGQVIIAEKSWAYTQLMVHSGWQESKVEPINLFLLGASNMDLKEGTPLLLESNQIGQPLSLSSEDGTLLWEQPASGYPWIAIYTDSITVKGPSERIGAEVIAISNWPGDDWVHIYVPPFLTGAVKALLVEAFDVFDMHTAFRSYDVLCMRIDDDTLLSDLCSVLLSLPNAVVLDRWS